MNYPVRNNDASPQFGALPKKTNTNEDLGKKRAKSEDLEEEEEESGTKTSY